MAWRRAWIGLGANLGDAQATLLQACAGLADLAGCRWVGRSAWYASTPVDSGGPDYVNGVAALDTVLPAEDLLAALLALEQRHGRERPYRNAPRTLDLDLLLLGRERHATATLTLPHPRLAQRLFVLEPLAELAPELVLDQGPIGPLLADLRRAAPDQQVHRLPA
jgi:2-amino-4-hydroxy-6-hydroxymethyldihydropteridine diphosphokinase